MIINIKKSKKLTLTEINLITSKLRTESINHLKTILPEEQITETLIIDHMKNRLKLYIKDIQWYTK